MFIRISLFFVWMILFFTIDFLQQFGTDVIAKRDFFRCLKPDRFLLYFEQRPDQGVGNSAEMRQSVPGALHVHPYLWKGKLFSLTKLYFLYLINFNRLTFFLFWFNYRVPLLNSGTWAGLVVPEKYLLRRGGHLQGWVLSTLYVGDSRHVVTLWWLAVSVSFKLLFCNLDWHQLEYFFTPALHLCLEGVLALSAFLFENSHRRN